MKFLYDNQILCNIQLSCSEIFAASLWIEGTLLIVHAQFTRSRYKYLQLILESFIHWIYYLENTLKIFICKMYLFSFYMYVYLACMQTCAPVHVLCPQRLTEGDRCLETSYG